MSDLSGWDKIVEPLKDKPEALLGLAAIIGTVVLVKSDIKDWLIILLPIAIFVLYCGTRIALAFHAERLRKLDVREIEAKGATRVAEITARRTKAPVRKVKP